MESSCKLFAARHNLPCSSFSTVRDGLKAPGFYLRCGARPVAVVRVIPVCIAKNPQGRLILRHERLVSCPASSSACCGERRGAAAAAAWRFGGAIRRLDAGCAPAADCAVSRDRRSIEHAGGRSGTRYSGSPHRVETTHGRRAKSPRRSRIRDSLVGGPSRAAAALIRHAGWAGVTCTSLLDHSSAVMGMISTHHRQACTEDLQQLALLAGIARRTATWLEVSGSA